MSADQWNEDVLEELGTAIGAMERAKGYAGPAAELGAEWREWWDGSLLRSLGPVGVPMVAGAAQGYWTRYRDLWHGMSPARRARLPTPQSIHPSAQRLLTAAGQDALDANQEAARTAYDAARRGAQVVLETVETVAEPVLEPLAELSEEMRRARKVAWIVVGAAAGFWLLAQAKKWT